MSNPGHSTPPITSTKAPHLAHDEGQPGRGVGRKDVDEIVASAAAEPRDLAGDVGDEPVAGLDPELGAVHVA